MDRNRMVHHDGTVISVNGSNVKVKIVSQSACGECHAKSMCNAAEKQDKIIDAISTESLEKGDCVCVVMEEHLGWKAIFYAFFLPFLVLVTVLFTMNGIGFSETHAALIALASLAPYYFIVYLFRQRIEKDFVFKAEKKNKF